MPALIPVPAPLPQPVAAPAQAAAAPQPEAPAPAAPAIVVASAEPVSTVPPAAPSQPEPVKSDSAKVEAVSPVAAKSEPAAPEPAQIHTRGGWLIQIGAFDGEDEAKQHLSAAQIKVHEMLAAADPFTERVQKGDKALFRARFAGFDKATAEAACKQLKHNDFECMTVKN
jgi:D-alanyl-D-alanine carboxypeptidase